MTERHYKREKVRGISLEKKGYDQARAFGPAFKEQNEPLV